MGKIYSAPETIKVPEFNFSDLKGSQEAEKTYIQQVIEWVKKHSKDTQNASYVGEEYRIPMGDGYARYIVQSIKPLAMIHLSVGDAWDSEWADRATATQVKQYIDGQKSLAKLFPPRKAS
jgi:hypothetical protein